MSAQDVITRWNGFLKKVEERMQAILAEADAGFDQVIAYGVTDLTGLTGAVTAFEARMNSLGQKVNDASTKLTDEDFELPFDEMIERGELLQLEIEIATHEMSVTKRAKAARLLKELVDQERDQPHKCSNCSSLLEITVTHAPSSPACKFCGAVNQVQPSMTVSNYYYGGSIDALAAEAALAEWRAMMEEEHRYLNLRTPSPAEEKKRRDAAETYHRAYHTAFARLHPDRSADQIEAEVKGAMSHFDLSF